MKQLLIFTSVILAVSFMTSGLHSGSPSKVSPPDTPRYQKIIRIEIGVGELGRIANVMDSLMNDYGVELGGSQIKNAKAMFTNHFNYLLNRGRLDSVLLNPKSKTTNGKLP